MKIQSVEVMACVEMTMDDECNAYRRFEADNWEELTHDGWQRLCDNSDSVLMGELEGMYIEWMAERAGKTEGEEG